MEYQIIVKSEMKRKHSGFVSVFKIHFDPENDLFVNMDIVCHELIHWIAFQDTDLDGKLNRLPGNDGR